MKKSIILGIIFICLFVPCLSMSEESQSTTRFTTTFDFEPLTGWNEWTTIDALNGFLAEIPISRLEVSDEFLAFNVLESTGEGRNSYFKVKLTGIVDDPHDTLYIYQFHTEVIPRDDRDEQAIMNSLEMSFMADHPQCEMRTDYFRVNETADFVSFVFLYTEEAQQRQ